MNVHVIRNYQQFTGHNDLKKKRHAKEVKKEKLLLS